MLGRPVIIAIVFATASCIGPPEHVPVNPFADATVDSGPDLATARDTGDGGRDAADFATRCGACADDRICDPRSGECVQCLVDAHCATGACEANTRTCVQCLESTSCLGAGAARCAENFTCQPCEAPTDCAHIAGRSACNEEGRCVECAAGQVDACGAFACNPRTQVCTATQAHSLELCEPCEADAECATGFACVAMRWGGELLHDGMTGYCLPEYVSADLGCPNTTRLQAVYTDTASLDDPNLRDFCAPALTTCAALSDWGKNCAAAAECGLGLGDAECAKTEGIPQSRCNWRCTADIDCPSGLPCLPTSDGYSICGPQ